MFGQLENNTDNGGREAEEDFFKGEDANTLSQL